MEKVGEFAEPQEPTADIHAMCVVMKEDVIFKTGANYEVFQAVLYRSQVVSGTNFLIKVHVGDGNYIHMLLFKALPSQGQLVLRAVQEHKKEEHPLEPFDS